MKRLKNVVAVQPNPHMNTRVGYPFSADGSTLPPEIKRQLQTGVREFMPNAWGVGVYGDQFGFYYPQELISPYWTRQCDIQLRRFFFAPHNTLVQGAINLVIENVLTTPYEIKGGRNATYKWSDILFEMDYGEGWDFLMSKFLTDFLTTNQGGLICVSAYGDPSTPLESDAKITGFQHLDSLRAIPTGNLEYPFLYYSEITQRPHKIHMTRIRRLSATPSPDTRRYGTGICALYKMISVSNAEMMLSRYQSEQLNDMPPPGLLALNNVRSGDWEKAMSQYESQRRTDGETTYRSIPYMESLAPDEPIQIQFIPFSTLPNDFDYKKYVEIHVNLVALALGIDPQDIWPLTGQALGTGAQSQVLKAKTRAKGYGYLLVRLERMFNTLLPRDLEFKFKVKDEEESKERADTALQWVTVASTAAKDGAITNDEYRMMLANTVEAFADVVLDEQRQLIRLPDDDPKDIQNEITAQDNAELAAGQNAPEAAPPQPVSGQPQPNTEDVTATDNATVKALTIHKDYDATESEFVDEIAAIMQDGIDRVMTKASCAARIRGVILRYGKQAYADGLEDGGVDPDEMDEDDNLAIADLNVKDSEYVSDLTDEIYSKEGMSGEPDSRAEMWGTKTLQAFYYAGVMSADKNGMYEFTGDDGKDSCSDCQKLQGTKHRMKWWVENEMRPGIDTDSFECGGWRCQHYLERVA